jgi:hypothetical protein
MRLMFTEEIQLEDHLVRICMPDWQRLLDLIPILEEKESYGRWSGEEQQPYLIPAEEVHQFKKLVYDLGLVVVYDWSKWEKGHNAWRMKAYDFSRMDVPEICKMITLLVRADRFTEGFLVEAFERRVILQILLALRQKVPYERPL